MLEMVLFNSNSVLTLVKESLKIYFLEIAYNVYLMMPWRSFSVCFILRPVFMILEINVTVQLTSSIKQINIVSTLPLQALSQDQLQSHTHSTKNGFLSTTVNLLVFIKVT
jgi:hypothetical protein